MGILNMKTRTLLQSIGRQSAASSALGSITQMREVLQQINLRVKALDVVWEGGSQQLYREKFDNSYTEILNYLNDLEGLINNMGTFANAASAWDDRLRRALERLRP